MDRRKSKAESKAAGYSSNRSHSTFDFPKEQKTSLATVFSQSESRQTGKDSTDPDTNAVQPSVFFLLLFFAFIKKNYIVSEQSTSYKTG